MVCAGGFMRLTRFACAALMAATLVAAPRDAVAQAAGQAQQIQQQIDQLRQEFNTRISALEGQLATLQGQAPPSAAPPAPPAPPAPEVGQGAALSNAKVFNPDMAMIGDFLGAAGRNTVNPSPALELHESEASFQAVVDPYARADFF